MGGGLAPGGSDRESLALTADGEIRQFVSRPHNAQANLES
jgi:hypothetical protein